MKYTITEIKDTLDGINRSGDRKIHKQPEDENHPNRTGKKKTK